MAEENEERFLKADLEGKDKTRWAKLKGKFIDRLHQVFDEICDLTINPQDQISLGEELTVVTSKGIGFLKAKLDAPSIENQKKLAEIGKLFAERKKILAEAEKIAFETKLKKMKLKLGMIKAFFSKNQDPETLIFTNQIDEFFVIIKEIEGTSLTNLLS